MRKLAIIVTLFTVSFVSAQAQTPDVESIIQSTVISFCSLESETANLVVVDTKGRRKPVENKYTLSVTREGCENSEMVLETRSGKKLTLVTKDGVFLSPAEYIRENGDEEGFNTSEPSSELPNIGLKLADVLYYLMSGELEDFKHLFVEESTKGCTIIHSQPETDYVYYAYKQIDVCDGLIGETRFYNSAGMLIKTISFSNFIVAEDGYWWRATKIVVDDIIVRRSVNISVNYITPETQE